MRGARRRSRPKAASTTGDAQPSPVGGCHGDHNAGDNKGAVCAERWNSLRLKHVVMGRQRSSRRMQGDECMVNLQLRTILRKVNTEYSALLRDQTASNRTARLTSLRRERERLMRLLAATAPSLRVVSVAGELRLDCVGESLPVNPVLPIPMAASGMAATPIVPAGGNGTV